MGFSDVKDISSAPVIPGPSNNSPPESVTLYVTDVQVADDFEVRCEIRMKLIEVLGGFESKLKLNLYKNLLSDVLNRTLLFQQKYDAVFKIKNYILHKGNPTLL